MSIWETDPEPAAASPPATPGVGSVWEQPPEAAPAQPQVGGFEDFYKGAAGGLGRGVAGLVGLPGDAAEYGARGINWINQNVVRPLGADVPVREDRAPDYGSADVRKLLESYTGPLYEPKTVPGQFASTIAEFAPGMVLGGGSLAARTANTLLGGTTSETLGQITKNTPYEPYARFIGGVGGSLAGSKAITPTAPASPAYQGAVRTLEAEGVPLTAGQRTGSKPVRWMESSAIDMPIVGAQAKRLEGAASSGLDRAATGHVYDRAELTARGVPDELNLPDPAVARAGAQSLSDNYDRLTQAPFVTNPRFQNRMTRAQDEYERLVMPHEQTAHVGATQNDIIDRLVAGQGRMAGDEYQSIRQQIGERQRAAGINPQEKIALTEYKRALDEAYMAGLSPAEAAALRENNLRYALQKQEPDQAVAASNGEHLSPLALANAVRARRGGQYSQRQGDMDELAAAAKMVMAPLPNSGTAARTAMHSGGGGAIGATVGTLIGGPFGTAIGAGVGAGIPLIAPGLATSRLGQLYLGNRALPQNARDIISQAMVQQAASQPSGVERNDRERKLQRVYIHGRQ